MPHLTPKQIQALELEKRGFTLEKIAEQMGGTYTSAAHSNLLRGRENIRKSVEDVEIALECGLLTEEQKKRLSALFRQK